MQQDDQDDDRVTRKPLDITALRHALAPPWPGAFENWARAYVRDYFFRVHGYFDTQDDAVQECALIFARCVNKYAHTVNNPRWFMALFQVAVKRDFQTFAARARKLWERKAHFQALQQPADVDYSLGPLVYKFASKSSNELKSVIAAVAGAPQEMLQAMFAAPRKRRINDAEKERLLSAQLCQYSGCQEANVLLELRTLLYQETSDYD